MGFLPLNIQIKPIDELAQLPPWNPADAAVKAKLRRTAAKTKISPPQQQQLQFVGFDGVSEPPCLLQHHHHSASEPVMFYGQSSPFGYDDTWTGGWEKQSVQRLVAWNSGGVTDTRNGGGGVYPSPTSYQPVHGQSQLMYSQRSPLQSSYTPMIRAWFDPHHHHSISTDDLNHHHHQFSSGFGVPARFQGQEEEQQDGLTNKPSSASSVSRH
ncbi:unnamed protein product [Eruca vesicaria subsp. sativa]|uniref:Growth-regulating factor n=1 Tax=Eruca vesicaria subsp. sativa TaxID=29727 RepID=A0ABC8JZQ1_ERUVS|nr:unnamed protein product [Eruca vesicaria subsp. sativa]